MKNQKPLRLQAIETVEDRESPDRDDDHIGVADAFENDIERLEARAPRGECAPAMLNSHDTIRTHWGAKEPKTVRKRDLMRMPAGRFERALDGILKGSIRLVG